MTDICPTFVRIALFNTNTYYTYMENLNVIYSDYPHATLFIDSK